MRISLEWLGNNGACADGEKWFLSQGETDGIKVVRKLLKEGKFEWANWTITRILDRRKIIQSGTPPGTL